MYIAKLSAKAILQPHLPFLYTKNGVMYDLNTLVSGIDPYTFAGVISDYSIRINDQGVIATTGTYNGGGASHIYVLTPTEQ